MKYLLHFLMLMLPMFLWSQTAIIKQSLAPGWQSSDNAQIHLVSTVGELAVREQNTDNLHLSEGFLSPDLSKSLKIDNYDKLEGIQIYPLPVHDNLHVKIAEKGNYELNLFSLNGQKIKGESFTNVKHLDIPVRLLAKGTYLLIIINHDKHQVFVTNILKN